MMNLTIVVPFVNHQALTKKSLRLLFENKTNPETKIIGFNNGSDIDLDFSDLPDLTIYSVEQNIGNYPVFQKLLEIDQKASIIGVLHNDLFVFEKGYDQRIINTFEQNQNLGLLGFVGSNQIDMAGGRGLGTMSNYQGNIIESNPLDGEPTIWTGSRAEVHGLCVTDFKNAAIVDGCSMIFRKQCLKELPIREEQPIHHFYDKIMSCQCLELGWRVGVLGIACDHIGGQTSTSQQSYFDVSKEWFAERGVNSLEDVARVYSVSIPGNWDHANYLLSEKMFLEEFRDKKHLFPITVT